MVALTHRTPCSEKAEYSILKMKLTCQEFGKAALQRVVIPLSRFDRSVVGVIDIALKLDSKIIRQIRLGLG